MDDRDARLPRQQWFAPYGCVVEHDDHAAVFVGGMLVGHWDHDDPGARNAALIGLVDDPQVHLGELGRAFKLSRQGVRAIRLNYAAGGLAAVVSPGRAGRKPKLTPALRQRMERWFAQGLTIAQVVAQLPRTADLKRATVGRVHREWRLAQAAPAPTPTPAPAAAVQLTLVADDQPAAPAALPSATPMRAAARSAAAARTAGGADPAAVVPSASWVQHLGTWLLLGQLERYRLYSLLADLGAETGCAWGPLRVALDAVVAALALGEGCVEGVRRLATPSGPALLRTSQVPRAETIRTVLHEFADVRAGELHLGMAGVYLRAAAVAPGPAVFYVDNHLRPYTGQQVVRRGWRMQDRRVRPGTTDYYVHDEDGRPVYRGVAPQHDSLVAHLQATAELLRLGVGPERRVLLAFDRGGAFTAALVGLRNAGFEFVTYERRPYPLLTPSAFDGEITLDGETIRYCDTRTNLRAGRGRLRRLALRYADGQQVNLLAATGEPPARLIEIMWHRWRQENGFKHGVERWGVNQLDSRTVTAYSPETVIPNPARRRLDEALRLAALVEGRARSALARLGAADLARADHEADLAESLARQAALLSARPQAPKKARLCDTELAGKLVFHRGTYKAVLDTVRIACINAEADLAALLAPHLPRGREAKRTLGNLLRAPGQLRATTRVVEVLLAPAATPPEREAFAHFFETLNTARLRLPADPGRRILRFGLQVK